MIPHCSPTLAAPAYVVCPEICRGGSFRSNRCGLTLRYAHQACGGGRVYAATAILGFIRFTTRAVFAPMALTCTCPRAPQNSRHAALFDYAQSAGGNTGVNLLTRFLPLKAGGG
ncbi:MAG: hypothetical protein WC299_16575 [Kiritimatiellia bacterium]